MIAGPSNADPALTALRAKVSLAFVAGALLLLGLSWGLTDALGASALGIAQPGFVASRSAAVDVQRVMVQPSASEDSRRSMADTLAEREPAAGPMSDLAGTPPRRVRVQGRLCCLIHGVPVHHVSFVNVDFPRIQDWDFIDEDWRYKVEVPPGRCDVVSHENDVETRLARVIVPADSAELALDVQAR